ncbi:rhophilin-2 [Schizosaccharomyces cryophilus OY26]|uniref:BRO domain-containing protein 1 n=1 Tax=Schizosaccharomyces cryophilus (strain OY26 / ATCC MYA-4695 / CBS 11777 / NBRC 106824 / NRRL Y48691) TaxID=653667 RepID=S9VYN8_SCHCR|nr:rhophilin-2 [Schizosaccharomyces cryophilus OY26]EPY52778.1 rhophilin-2 [Schizosaccharomyces cryophilus OY26]
MERLLTPFLFLKKKETERIDWVEPFTTFVSRIYGNSIDIDDEIKNFNSLRDNMLGADDTNSGKNVIYSYYGQLDYLSFRFPTGGNGIDIAFEWKDSLSKGDSWYKQSSLAFERACVLFNLAGLLSRLAATHTTRYTVQDYKQAANYLQCASGIFKMIRESFLHAPGNDFDSQFLLGIHHLLLAQAQECVLGHMSMSKMSSSLAAKIANSAASLYESSVRAFESMEPSTNTFFVSLASAKNQTLEGIACYLMAQSCKQESKYGLAIGFYNKAKSKLQAGQKSFSWLKPDPDFIHKQSTTEYTNYLSTFIKDNLKNSLSSTEKDNDFVFHEPVVREAELPQIQSLQALPYLTLDRLYSGKESAKSVVGEDLFKAFVPSAITTAISLYSEETAKLYRSEQEEVERQNTQLATVFASLDIEHLQELTRSDSSSSALPKELADARAKLLNENFQEAFQMLKDKPTQLKRILIQSESELDKESLENSKMSSRFGAAWTLSPSQVFASPFRQQIHSFFQDLEKAAVIDKAILQQYNSIKEDIETLCDINKMDTLFGSAAVSLMESSNVPNLLDLPDDNTELEREMKIQLDLLEELQVRVQKLVPSREATLKTLQEKCLHDDISEPLMQNSNKNESSIAIEQLFAQQLKKFDPMRNRLHGSYRQQQLLLGEMRNAVQKLKQNPNFIRKLESYTQSFTKNKDLSVRLLSSAITANAIAEGTSNGLNYYRSLEERIGDFDSKLKNRLLSRRKEGAQCLANMTSNNPSHLSSNMRNLHL